MKILLLFAVLAGGTVLLGNRRERPFISWGVVLAVAGVLLASTTVLFATRSLVAGVVLLAAGAAVYYYGRVVRRERLVLPKR